MASSVCVYRYLLDREPLMYVHVRTKFYIVVYLLNAFLPCALISDRA